MQTVGSCNVTILEIGRPRFPEEKGERFFEPGPNSITARVSLSSRVVVWSADLSVVVKRNVWPLVVQEEVFAQRGRDRLKDQWLLNEVEAI